MENLQQNTEPIEQIDVQQQVDLPIEAPIEAVEQVSETTIDDPNKKIRQLYSTLSTDEVYKDLIGDEKTFIDKMKNQDKVKQLYSTLSSDDVYKDLIGDEQTFMAKMGVGKPQLEGIAAQSSGGESQSKRFDIAAATDFALGLDDARRKGGVAMVDYMKKSAGNPKFARVVEIFKKSQEDPNFINTLSSVEQDALRRMTKSRADIYRETQSKIKNRIAENTQKLQQYQPVLEEGQKVLTQIEQLQANGQVEEAMALQQQYEPYIDEFNNILQDYNARVDRLQKDESAIKTVRSGIAASQMSPDSYIDFIERKAQLQDPEYRDSFGAMLRGAKSPIRGMYNTLVTLEQNFFDAIGQDAPDFVVIQKNSVLIDKLLDESERTIAESKSMFTEGINRDNAAAAVGNILGFMVLGAATGGNNVLSSTASLGARAKSLAPMASIFYGDTYDAAVESGFTKGEAAAIALTLSGVMAVSEKFLGSGRLVKGLLGESEKLTQKELIKQILKQGKEQGFKNFKDAAKNAGTVLLNTAKESGIQAVDEGLQAAFEIGTKSLANEVGSGQFDVLGVDQNGNPIEVNMSNVFDYIADNALAGAVGGSIPSFIVANQQKSGINRAIIKTASDFVLDPSVEQEFLSAVDRGVAEQKISESDKKIILAGYEQAKMAALRIPKDVVGVTREKMISLVSEKARLQEEMKNLDEAFLPEKQARMDAINAEIKTLDDTYRGKVEQAPIVEEVEKPLSNSEQEKLLESIDKLGDNEINAFTFESIEDVPASLRSKAKEVQGSDLTVTVYGKGVKGLLNKMLNKGEKVVQKRKPYYVVSVSGAELRELANKAAEQSTPMPEGVKVEGANTQTDEKLRNEEGRQEELQVATKSGAVEAAPVLEEQQQTQIADEKTSEQKPDTEKLLEGVRKKRDEDEGGQSGEQLRAKEEEVAVAPSVVDEGQVSGEVTAEPDALKDIESTAKALEGVELPSNFVSQDKGGILNRENYYRLAQEKFQEREGLTIEEIFDKNKQREEFKTQKGRDAFQKRFEQFAENPKNKKKIISEAYHKAKTDGSNPELVKAVEDLLGNVQQNEAFSVNEQPQTIEQPSETKNVPLANVEAIAKVLEGVQRENADKFVNDFANIDIPFRQENIQAEIDSAVKKQLFPNEKTRRKYAETIYSAVVRSSNFPKILSEAYHKAKADGSNPELVKAVEELLTPKTNEKANTEEASTEGRLLGQLRDGRQQDEGRKESPELRTKEEAEEVKKKKAERISKTKKAKAKEKEDLVAKKDEALARLKKLYGELFSGNVGITVNAKDSAKKMYERHKAIRDVAEAYIQLGIVEVSEFAKQAGLKLTDPVKLAFKDAMNKISGNPLLVNSEADMSDESVIDVRQMFNDQRAAMKEPSSFLGKGIVKGVSRFHKAVQSQIFNSRFFAEKAVKAAQAFKAYEFKQVVSGASSAAKQWFEGQYKGIYKGMSNDKRNMLDDVIQALRVIEIDSQYDARKEARISSPRGLQKEEMENFLLKLETEDPELYKELMGRASKYQEAMDDLLDMRLKSGRITQDLYDKLKGRFYSPRMFMQHMMDAEDIEGRLKVRTVQGIEAVALNDIKKLEDGSLNLLMHDSEILLKLAASTTFTNIANNIANKAIGDFLKTMADKKSGEFEIQKPNGVKDGQPTFPELNKGEGYIFYFDENGTKVAIKTTEDIADSWNKKERVLSSYMAYQVEQWTLASLLKASVTGTNIGFAFVNIPMDMFQQMFFTNNYSSFVPLAAAQFTYQFLTKGIGGGLFKTKIYRDAIEAGMGMDGLATRTRSGTFKREGNTFGDAVMDVLAFIPEASETAGRLAAFAENQKRLRKQFIKNNNGNLPNNDEMKEINRLAASKAKQTLDYSRSGRIGQLFNTFIPYLNANLQVIDKSVTYMNDNKMTTAFKVAQFMTLSSLLAYWNMGFDDDDRKNGIRPIDPVQQASGLIVKMPWIETDERTGKKYRPYLYLRTSNFLSLPLITSNELSRLYLTGDYSQQASELYSAATRSTLSGVDITASSPIISAMTALKFNYDLYRMEKIWKGTENLNEELKYDERTQEVFKLFGEFVDKSPAQLQTATSKVIGNVENNMVFNMLTGPISAIAEANGSTSTALQEAMGKTFGKMFSSVYGRFMKKAYEGQDLSNSDEYQKLINSINVKANRKIVDQAKKWKDANSNKMREWIKSDFDNWVDETTSKITNEEEKKGYRDKFRKIFDIETSKIEWSTQMKVIDMIPSNNQAKKAEAYYDFTKNMSKEQKEKFQNECIEKGIIPSPAKTGSAFNIALEKLESEKSYEEIKSELQEVYDALDEIKMD